MLAIKSFARKILPVGLIQNIRYVTNAAGDWRKKRGLARLRKELWTQKPGSLVRCLDYIVRISDGHNFFILYKDIFMHRIYHFKAERLDPLILDCGSNIGMSILYFKRIYSKARIIGFEPDPAIFPYLEENIARNGLLNVRLIQAAVGKQNGTFTFCSDGVCSSHLAQYALDENPQGWAKHEVSCVRLRDYLVEPVDFLKMNIEGAEWDVLADSEDRLRHVNEMVIEYHHLPGLPRTLHKILELLHRQGFEYLINDFDPETNEGTLPPFCLTPQRRYFLLVYAKRMD